MRQRKAIFNVGNLVIATERSKAQVKYLLNKAEEIKADSRKGDRLKKGECKACFYNNRMGGAAMTSRECMSCDQDQIYSSTSTDVLCKDCADKHGLCKHCGGDIEMKAGRRKWPV